MERIGDDTDRVRSTVQFHKTAHQLNISIVVSQSLSN